MIAHSLQHDGRATDDLASAEGLSKGRWPRVATAVLALAASLGLWWLLLRAADVLL